MKQPVTLMRRLIRTLIRLGRNELGFLITLSVVVCCLWIFAEIADEVLAGSTQTVDEQILLALRNSADLSDPLGPKWLEEVARDTTALGGVAVLVFLSLAVGGFMLLDGKLRMLLFTWGAVGIGLIFSTVLKELFDRPRPDLVPHGSYVYTASFPSGHSMLAAIVYLTLGALLARSQGRKVVKAYLLLLASVLTIAVGISRVYLGVHWPTDVLAGWTAGTAWALLCWTIARSLQKSRAVEREQDQVPDVLEAERDMDADDEAIP
jgi:undecaprenyl-diphosphatase